MSEKTSIFTKVVAATNCPHYIPVRFFMLHGADRCAWCTVKALRARRKR